MKIMIISGLIIAAGDRMFLGIQNFNFAQNLIKFAQILITFAQI